MDQILGSSSQNILSHPIHGGRAFTTSERRNIDLTAKIKGWGSDLDPAVRPGVPMDKALGIGIEFLYPNFEQQIPNGKVHKSNEHARMTPVFGNVCPPRGVSGKLRDLAFRFSEGKLSHWLLLVIADRVDVVEDLLIDLAHFRIPNIPHEMGLAASWKYNRKGVAQKALFLGASVVAIWAIENAIKKNSQRQPSLS